jgi:TonB family C-terminal domain
MLLLIALVQAVAQPAAPPQQIASAVLSSEDYPDAAVLLGQEGVVEAQLTIAANGRPTDCTIAHSSGFPALDGATCKAFRTRARFKPALDSQGRPTIAKWVQTVRWAIEGNELPVSPWTIRLMAALNKKGSLTNCAIQAGGELKRDEMIIDCAELSGAFTVPPDLSRRFAGHEAVIVFDQQFVPSIVPSIDTPKDLDRFPLISRQVVHFQIDAHGLVGACTRTRAEGDYTPVLDGCDAMRGRRFKPSANGGSVRTPATATTAIYTYVK